MGITTKQTNPGESTLVFSGQLDFSIRKEFQVVLENAQTEDIHHIILDLTQVSFIDYAAIELIVQAKHKLAKTKTRLSLIAVPGRVSDILQLMNSDELFPVSPADQDS